MGADFLDCSCALFQFFYNNKWKNIVVTSYFPYVNKEKVSRKVLLETNGWSVKIVF